MSLKKIKNSFIYMSLLKRLFYKMFFLMCLNTKKIPTNNKKQNSNKQPSPQQHW